MKKTPHKVHSKTSLLCDYHSETFNFKDLDSLFFSFQSESFSQLPLRKRFKSINQTLCNLIQEAPTHSFLLSSVMEFISRVNKEKILNETYTFSSFEFWLNQFSNLSDKDNYSIRGKITGKIIPRAEYQVFFPIGMDRTYTGTHFVASHLSPDVDTMIAGLWGWMDAFAARVGNSLHLWSLPGGPPDSPITNIIKDLFGTDLFQHIAQSSLSITLSAKDLVTQRKFSKELGGTLTSSIAHHPNEKAVILVNEQGHYLGDWRNSDVEVVSQLIILFKSCLRWFETNFHSNVISLFAKKDLSPDDFMLFNSTVFDLRIGECAPAKEFNDKQQGNLQNFLIKILRLENGLNSTFRDLNLTLAQLEVGELLKFQEEVEALPQSDIFDKHGRLKEDRSKIFQTLKQIIQKLDDGIQNVRNYVERLDIAINIKHKVLNLPQIYVTLKSDVEEIYNKIQALDFITVVVSELDGSVFPVGIIDAESIRANGMGTISLRDFCNLEEAKIAPYFEVISVIDHHKTSLKTLSVPLAIIGDAQSCNVLIAEKSFEINDKFGLSGMTLQQVENQMSEVQSSLHTSSDMRILGRLLQKKTVALHHSEFFIDPMREFNEYLTFLYAILDDTDLLTKVSNRDLHCVAELLNRMKSLSLNKEVEIIHFDDLVKDKTFVKKAAQRILHQEDMYSLYHRIYSYREKEVDINLEQCIHGNNSTIFLDAKAQNGCARIGQTKLFSSNFPFFLEKADTIRRIWLKKSMAVYNENSDIDLHMHMISTIASAQEVYENRIGPYPHQDELWFWVPSTPLSLIHLNTFLSGFQFGVNQIKETMSIEFLGPNAYELLNLFSQHFPDVSKTIDANYQQGMPLVVFRFKAGMLNSRKSMISPYLPRL